MSSRIAAIATPLFAMLVSNAAPAQNPAQHFEARHTHPLEISSDGRHLFALNSREGRLSVFDVASSHTAASPVLVAEIPVGLEPVAVRESRLGEVWVVNEVSDSVAVVSLAQGAVVVSLTVPDEPADVVFAGGKGFVSCSRSNQVKVFDVASRQALGTIAIQGLTPRTLAVNAEGNRVYAAMFHSGNGTTTLPASEAPVPPAPTNAALPAAPKTAIIVPTSDPRVKYTVLDHDVAEIDVTSHQVLRYIDTVGTNLFALAIHPSDGAVWVAHTEALNRIATEPALRGHFVDNRLARIAITDGGITFSDLNPGIDYGVLPNPTAQAIALAQPMGLIWNQSGTRGYVAAFGSDRVGIIDSTGQVVGRIDVRLGAGSSRSMRGPRGLAFSHDGRFLYVLNKLSDSLSVIDTTTDQIKLEIPLSSHRAPISDAVVGKGFLFDARLSGNGAMSCASCHPDADRDGIAWDLGDPGGEMMSVIGYNNSIHDATPRQRVMHPMKGALTTQTLRGFQPGQLFHWRGDRPTIQSFNGTFNKLMGSSEIPTEDMNALAAYLNTLVLHPNPNRTLARGLPTTFAGGNPSTGRTLFNDHLASHCATCHVLPTGSDNNIDLMVEVGSTQPVKTPPLRTVYQRANFSRKAGAVNLTGYGMLKEGTGSFEGDPVGHFYVLENLQSLQQYIDVQAFVLCFDTGTAPAVGASITVDAQQVAQDVVSSNLATLESQAKLTGASAACDLIARGRVKGEWRSYYYERSVNAYRADRAGESLLDRTSLLAQLGAGDSLTFMGVLPEQGIRWSIDRDLDGTLNQDEGRPQLVPSAEEQSVTLKWPNVFADWILEESSTLQEQWQARSAGSQEGTAHFQHLSPTSSGNSFFRLRRTW